MKNYEKCAQAGDYFIPKNRIEPVEDKALNKYGRMRRAYLQEQKPMLFDNLLLTEQLFPHLYEVQEVAEDVVVREVIYSD